MFGGNNKKESTAKSNGSTSVSSGLNSLVKGTVVEGTVKSESDIRVDGTIKGTLHCDAKVIIGPTGYVEGEIRCQNAVVEGKFEGSIQVAELLNIRESASVSGEVSTEKLIVQSGATFNVTCSMGGGITSSKNGSKASAQDKSTVDSNSAKSNKAASAR
ncbi:bactofilin family protein [Phaeodactylibacter luteus]|uniref:Polymer-forming cytoskeletal protein n=1 Tax=Phaeodactylibacter luteus TaxID=1564516 RepID=A0A5C6RM51_9BACT|nr:polymer-forming cytoskeletal protein [Phaeodactylibacter luteus]TXB63034.1 polymer-forming cytoskeletal protein [Phaeodactylibacter luteus]